MKIILVFLVLLNFSFIIMASNEDAVVQINVNLASGTWKQGTGFFFSADAGIITAYHVIEGAKRINIILNGIEGYRSDVVIESISSKYDVAILRVPSLNHAVLYLPLVNYIPSVVEQLQLIGYPRIGNLDTYLANVTSNKYIQSKIIRAGDGAEIFRENIDLITINVTNYVGLSGAPVVSRQGVIGILSGSYSEGGAKAWVIPTKYFNKVDRLGKTPQEISVWEPLTLMSPNFRDFRRTINLNSDGNRLITAFLDEVDNLISRQTALSDKAGKLRAHATAVRYLVEINPNMETLKPQIAAIVDENNLFGEEQRKVGESARSLARILINLHTWFSNETSMTDSLKMQLIRGLDEIKKRYSNVKGLYEAVGLTEESFKTELYWASKFHEALPQSKELALQYIANYLATVETNTGKLSSVQALQNISENADQCRASARLYIKIMSNLP